MPVLGKKGPSKAVRQGGGFRPGNFGNFNEEHLERNSSSQAVSQFSQNQQAASAAQQSTGGSALKKFSKNQTSSTQQQRPPRSMGTLKEELLDRPVKDALDEIKHLFSLHRLLNIDSSGDLPEDKARKKQMIQRLSKIDNEIKQVAEQNYQKELERKKQEEEEKERKKQEEKQKKKESRSVPTKKRKGPIGMAGKSKKQKAKLTLDSKRGGKGLSRAGGLH